MALQSYCLGTNDPRQCEGDMTEAEASIVLARSVIDVAIHGVFGVRGRNQQL